MKKQLNFLPLLVLWMSVMTTALYLRPILPMDETRYVSVAWSMWQDGNWLVPTLNGELYSHKPPLLFWLMMMGWHIFGVVDWWPRLIAPLFGLGSIILTHQLSLQLWPRDLVAARIAPVILFGSIFWLLFGTLTMFDTILAFFTLLGLVGTVHAWRNSEWVGFLLVGVALGLGTLAKGPAIFVHLIPIVCSAPWWGRHFQTKMASTSKRHWYSRMMVVVIFSIIIALFWAVPAGIEGGKDYRDAIFWGQSAGRMVDSFAHARPFWWFFVWILPLFIPWVFWFRVWRGLINLYDNFDGASLFCMIWFGSAFITFSAISGKQLHYLLPEFPAIALLFARTLSNFGRYEIGRVERIKPLAFYLMFGLLLLLLSSDITHLSGFNELEELLLYSKMHWGLIILVFCVLFTIPRTLTIENTSFCLSTMSAISIIVIHLIVSDVLSIRYNFKPLALEIKRLQDLGYEVANANKYHGQFDFLGRLKRPIWVVGQRNGDLEAFLAKNQRTRIVVYYANMPTSAKPLLVTNFRRYTVAILDGHDVALDPDLINRN